MICGTARFSPSWVSSARTRGLPPCIYWFSEMTDTSNIELVAACLIPFDWSVVGSSSIPTIPTNALSGSSTSSADEGGMTAAQTAQAAYLATSAGMDIGYFATATTTSTATGSLPVAGQPLYPLYQSGGLVFPYNPTISESLGTRYDVTEVVHSNQNVHTFKNNDNVRITLSECIWTAETFDQAIYTLGVIHFFRSYRLMDFGRGKSGRPPSPMWFSAYGSYLYNAIPVIIERVDFSFPADIDYVRVPNPGTDAYNSQTLTFSQNSSAINSLDSLVQTGDFTWIPVKFTVNSISMVVQNAVNYWTTKFDLAAFKAGQLVGVR